MSARWSGGNRIRSLESIYVGSVDTSKICEAPVVAQFSFLELAWACIDYLRNWDKVFVKVQAYEEFCDLRSSATMVFTCDGCPTHFSRKSSLQRHYISKHMEVRHQCDECEQAFSRKDLLLRHVSHKHRYNTKSCSSCQRSIRRDLWKRLLSICSSRRREKPWSSTVSSTNLQALIEHDRFFNRVESLRWVPQETETSPQTRLVQASQDSLHATPTQKPIKARPRGGQTMVLLDERVRDYRRAFAESLRKAATMGDFSTFASTTTFLCEQCGMTLNDIDDLLAKGSAHDTYCTKAHCFAFMSLAASIPHPEFVKYLISLGAGVNKGGCHGGTPLHRAAQLDHGAVMTVLLDAGADSEALDDSGKTPLYDAVKYGRVASMRILLQRGAKANGSPQSDKETPLALCCDQTKADPVRVLLAGGADVDLKRPTPLERALMWSTPEIVQMLLTAGAKVSLVSESTRSELVRASNNFSAQAFGTHYFPDAMQKMWLIEQFASGLLDGF